MAKEAYNEWYLAGSHAVRSACEQGNELARKAHGLATNPELKTLAADAAETAARHQEAFVGFIKDLGAEPNDFRDQIMDGVGRGTELMLEAATEKTVIDVALVSGGQSALHYFIAAFGTHAAAAKALGHAPHAATLKTMSDECKALDLRYTVLAETALNVAAAA